MGPARRTAVRDRRTRSLCLDLVRRDAGQYALLELDMHISNPAICAAALLVFDQWVARGLVPPGAI